ncbi:fumarylacetoacetate hydrolase family protein [Marinobacter sp. OP 3.4]|uniref:fumarylacetoacetate hydrolase family protein n=1 Tax=Marinobacter sp. OP 3.4 TaxID=3076501 RepID=UPI002E1D6111
MYVRFNDNNKEIHEGYLEGDKVFYLNGPMLEGGSASERSVALADVRLLAPCEPSKVVCVGLNYRDHAAEMNESLPKEPLLFMKPSTSVIGHQEAIVAPAHSKRLDYEGELGIVIAKRAKNVSVEEASGYIFGYTCANDFTARDLQLGDKQWTRGKSFDTFCPIGPGIVPTINQADTTIELTVNGEVRQRSNLNQLIFNVHEVVSYISAHMTLLPGDVILTGTPHGVGPVTPGDSMTVTIDGIGSLTNQLVAG